MGKSLQLDCSGCGSMIEFHRVGKQRYCLKCHASNMRKTRPKHRDLPEIAKKKAVTRAYTGVLIKRGVLQKSPCEVCGSDKAQAHHHDYSKPRDVQWLCRPCHLEHHRKENEMIVN